MTEIEKWQQLAASCSFCGLGFVSMGNTFENERHFAAAIICCVWSCTNRRNTVYNDVHFKWYPQAVAIWFLFYTHKFMELCTTLELFKNTLSIQLYTVPCVMLNMIHKSRIFIWCLVSFERHFLTMPQKCHSVSWSGLDSGQKAKRRGKKDKVERTCWEGLILTF